MPIIRSPDVLLGTLESGELIQDFQTEINSVIETLQALSEQQRGKIKGSVTLQIGFEVEDGQCAVRAKLDSKTPKADRPKSFFFVTDAGLSTDHPRQLDMWSGPREARATARDAETA